MIKAALVEGSLATASQHLHPESLARFDQKLRHAAPRAGGGNSFTSMGGGSVARLSERKHRKQKIGEDGIQQGGCVPAAVGSGVEDIRILA